MASIVEREDSPFFFIQYKTDSGNWSKRKLPILRSDPDGKRKCAMALADEHVREAAMMPAGEKQVRGWGWVPQYLTEHYENEKSRQRAFNAWAPLSVFLTEMKLTEPALVTFAHGHEYVAWRQVQRPGMKKRAKNTALLEIKFLSRVVQHAVRLGLAHANPLYRLGIKKDAPKEKVEITKAEQAVIEAALADEKPWMRDAWDVMMKQGCRIGATATPLRDIDEEEGTILFLKQKGKRHLAPLHKDLLPLVARRKAEGAEKLVDVPRMGSIQWWKFFKRIGMGHHCAHDTRVTVITRLARKGVPARKTMRYVGHGSVAVHAVYTKLKTEDVEDVGDLL